MLGELIQALAAATTPKAKERAYRMLEKVGVDRRTADVLSMEVKLPGETAKELGLVK